MLFWNESARVVDPADYRLYDWTDWSQLRAREGERFIQAVRLRLRVPEVIVLADYDRLPKAAVSFSRRNVFKRDHWACQYCGCQPGGEELTIDHVIPRSQGGTSTWDNCVLACIGCNKRKADSTPQQAGMRLRKAPVRPRWKPIYAPRQRADRKLVEVHQRDVLERPVGEVMVSFGPRGLPPGPYTSVLLGEQPASKAGGRGSTPRARACRRGSTEKGGAGLVNRLILVRIQSSALLICPDGVADRIGPSEGPGPGSSPGRDIGLKIALRVCRIARQRSKLQDGVRLLGEALIIRYCPRSVADSHATLRRSRARFNSWRGHLLFCSPDEGGALCATATLMTAYFLKR